MSDIERRISIDLVTWQDQDKSRSMDFFASQKSALKVSLYTIQKSEEFYSSESFEIPIRNNYFMNFDKVWYESKKPFGEYHYDCCCLEIPDQALKVCDFCYEGEHGTYLFNIKLCGNLRVRDDPFYNGGSCRCYSQFKSDVHGELVRPLFFVGCLKITSKDSEMTMCYQSDPVIENRNMLMDIEKPLTGSLMPFVYKPDDADDEEVGFEKICLSVSNGFENQAKFKGNGPKVWPECNEQQVMGGGISGPEEIVQTTITATTTDYKMESQKAKKAREFKQQRKSPYSHHQLLSKKD